MSMNIDFEASRVIQIVKTGHTEVQKCQFEQVWQTPTDVTYSIVNAADPVQAYKDWILRECSIDEEFPIYAEDDVFEEKDPIGVDIYNAGKEHIEIFDQWLAKMNEGSWIVKPVIG